MQHAHLNLLANLYERARVAAVGFALNLWQTTQQFFTLFIGSFQLDTNESESELLQLLPVHFQTVAVEIPPGTVQHHYHKGSTWLYHLTMAYSPSKAPEAARHESSATRAPEPLPSRQLCSVSERCYFPFQGMKATKFVHCQRTLCTQIVFLEGLRDTPASFPMFFGCWLLFNGHCCYYSDYSVGSSD